MKTLLNKVLNRLGYQLQKLPRKQKVRLDLGKHFDFGKDVPGRAKITAYFMEQFQLHEVLDIGCGSGNSINQFAENGIAAKGIDMLAPELISFPEGCSYEQVNVLSYEPPMKHKAIYSSHAIEHIPDTEQFLKKIFSFTEEGGHFCIIWPKPKPEIVSGHVHIFNLGLMLYNLVRIGIDCSTAKCAECQYSLAIMGEYRRFELPELTHNEGDIERLSAYFPFRAEQGFHGEFIPGIVKLK